MFCECQMLSVQFQLCVLQLLFAWQYIELNWLNGCGACRIMVVNIVLRQAKAQCVLVGGNLAAVHFRKNIPAVSADLVNDTNYIKTCLYCQKIDNHKEFRLLSIRIVHLFCYCLTQHCILSFTVFIISCLLHFISSQYGSVSPDHDPDGQIYIIVILSELNSSRTRSAKLRTAVPDGGPMCLFFLICFFSAYHLGVTVGAPANSNGGRLGCPFYLNLHLSCWGSTNWKAVVMALYFTVTTGSGTTWGEEWACAFCATGVLQ